MNAAVTGGTGFLGAALVRLLVKQPGRVKTLVRRPRDEDRLRSLGALPVRGDLTVPSTLAGLVEPGDTVFHCAARVEMTGRWSAFQKTTIQGTENLLAAAIPQRPARFVYASSAVVYSPAALGNALCADRSPTGPASYNYYGRAKLAAETLVRNECERAGCPWTIVRIGFLYGPGNRALLKHFVPILRRDRLFVIGDGLNRIAVLYVDDAARAVLLSCVHPIAAGRIYDVASDDHVTQRQFLDALADAVDLPRTRRKAHYKVAFAITSLADLAAKLPGCEPPFSRAMVALMSADQVLDSTRIRIELGWRPEVSFTEGMDRTREWYRNLQKRTV